MSTHTHHAQRIKALTAEIEERLDKIGTHARMIERVPGTSVIKSSTLSRLIRAAEDAVRGPDGQPYHGFEEHHALRKALEEFYAGDPLYQHPAAARPRYVLHPGYVISRNDGQRHYIPSSRLVELYGIRPGDHWVSAGLPGQLIDQPGDIHLHPREDGDYRNVHTGAPQ